MSLEGEDSVRNFTLKDLKTKFRQDLLYLIKNLQEEGYKIIIGGDFNKKQDKVDNVLEEITEKGNMQDVLRKFKLHDIPTHKKRINTSGQDLFDKRRFIRYNRC
jgi:exonuclease III